MAKQISFYSAIFILWILFGFSGTSAFGQCTGEVLNISAPTPSQTGTTGSWTVSAGGPYKVRLTAKGAKGGASLFYGGGQGATIVGEYVVVSGQVIEAMAGAGGSGGSAGGSGGGGGGSGFRIQNGPLLMVAGGGSGGGTSSNSQGGQSVSTGTSIGGGNGGSVGNNQGNGFAGQSDFNGVGGIYGVGFFGTGGFGGGFGGGVGGGSA